jgi:hypothetical protein
MRSVSHGLLPHLHRMRSWGQCTALQSRQQAQRGRVHGAEKRSNVQQSAAMCIEDKYFLLKLCSVFWYMFRIL